MIVTASSTLIPYDTVERDDIQYTYCHDYNHICRYKGLRQVIHQAESADRFVALETPNSAESRTDVIYYTVPSNRENRLDLIAADKLGSPTYSWVIAYFNGIEDGFTCLEGTRLKIPTNITSLFQSGELLANIPASRLNLGTE